MTEREEAMEAKAIILAAGMGTRLKPLTLTSHKCMTKVNGTPIIHNALNCLKSIGVKEVEIVVGYLAEEIRNTLGDSFDTVKLNYTINDIYSETNTSYSLKLGLETAKNYDRLFVLEGDVFFSLALLERLADDRHENATLLEKYNPALDGTFAQVDESGYVIDWTHKSMREPGYTLEDKYKTINLHKFGKAFVESCLYPSVEKTCRKTQGKDPLENVMRSIVRKDQRAVYGLDSAGIKWFEIDDCKDLAIAEELFREEAK